MRSKGVPSLGTEGDVKPAEKTRRDACTRKNLEDDPEGFNPDAPSPYASEPDVETYNEEWGTGYAHQNRFNQKFGTTDLDV